MLTGNYYCKNTSRRFKDCAPKTLIKNLKKKKKTPYVLIPFPMNFPKFSCISFNSFYGVHEKQALGPVYTRHSQRMQQRKIT